MFGNVDCGHGSLLLWQHCNVLYTSCFVDVLVYHLNSANSGCKMLYITVAGYMQMIYLIGTYCESYAVDAK